MAEATDGASEPHGTAAYQPVRNPLQTMTSMLLTDEDQARATLVEDGFVADPARMLRALFRLHRHHQRWPWRMRKRYFDLIRHMERAGG